MLFQPFQESHGIGWDGIGINCFGMGWDRTEKYVPWTRLNIIHCSKMSYDLVKKGNSYFYASKNLLLGLITKYYSSRSLDLLTANEQTSNKLENTAPTRLRSLLAFY